MARNDEYAVQASIVSFVRRVAPPPIALIWHCPNGGFRTKREAALLKWIGVLPGVPDLQVATGEGRMALWEVKTEQGRLSRDQAAMLALLDDMGISYAIVRSIDDARRELARLGVDTREAAAA